MSTTYTCVLILSDKSSGSTLLQKELAKSPDIHLIAKTRHGNNETLYWNKAAGLLGLHQETITDSDELPVTADQARQEIEKLLSENLKGYIPPSDDEKLVFEGWHALCKKYAPIFLEKSPHHLHYGSALDLIHECSRRYPDVRFFYVGLVRNPMDTLYSMHRRWNSDPQVIQYEWLQTYQNLMKFKRLVGNQLKIIRYEDLVRNDRTIKALCAFLGITRVQGMGTTTHTKSLGKWQRDFSFKFELAQEIVDFAKSFGYTEKDLRDRKSFLSRLFNL